MAQNKIVYHTVTVYPENRAVSTDVKKTEEEKEELIFDETFVDKSSADDIDSVNSDEKTEKKDFFTSIADFFKKIFTPSEKESNQKVNENDFSSNVGTTTATEAKSVNIPQKKDEYMTGLSMEDSGIVNEKIDETFKQGNIGDCNFLSTILSLSFSPEGAKLLSDAISINKDNSGNVVSYSVTFEGINETYTITAEELSAQDYIKEQMVRFTDEQLAMMGYTPDEIAAMSEEDKIQKQVNLVGYSNGDNDVLLLEMAFKKCLEESQNPILNELKNQNTENALDGVTSDSIAFLLTGKQGYHYHSYKDDSGISKADYAIKRSEIKYLNQFVSYWENEVEDINGNSVKIESNTVYKTSVSKNKDNVEIVSLEDPKTHKKYKVSMENLLTENITGSAFKGKEEILQGVKSGYPVTFGHSGNEDVYVTDVNGEKVKINKKHAFSVKAFDGENISLVNPHDASKMLVIPLEQLDGMDIALFMYQL